MYYTKIKILFIMLKCFIHDIANKIMAMQFLINVDNDFNILSEYTIKIQKLLKQNNTYINIPKSRYGDTTVGIKQQQSYILPSTELAADTDIESILNFYSTHLEKMMSEYKHLHDNNLDNLLSHTYNIINTFKCLYEINTYNLPIIQSQNFINQSKNIANKQHISIIICLFYIFSSYDNGINFTIISDNKVSFELNETHINQKKLRMIIDEYNYLFNHQIHIIFNLKSIIIAY